MKKPNLVWAAQLFLTSADNRYRGLVHDGGGEMRAGGEIKCPAGTVYIPKGQFEGQEIGEMCVDQGEFTNKMALALKVEHPELDIPQSPPGYDRPGQPLGNVSGFQAARICEARGMRLLTPVEWAYAASGPNRFGYSTRSGRAEKPGIHGCMFFEPINIDEEAKRKTRELCPNGPRDVGAAVGHYVEWGGQELFDMNGNVWEWTYDNDFYYYTGGSWGSTLNVLGTVNSTLKYRPDSDRLTDLKNHGFRCAVGERLVASLPSFFKTF